MKAHCSQSTLEGVKISVELSALESVNLTRETKLTVTVLSDFILAIIAYNDFQSLLISFPLFTGLLETSNKCLDIRTARNTHGEMIIAHKIIRNNK
jgi:hypothetical protein